MKDACNSIPAIQTLETKIMNRLDGFDLCIFGVMGILHPKKGRDKTGLPVIAMDHIREEVYFGK